MTKKYEYMNTKEFVDEIKKNGYEIIKKGILELNKDRINKIKDGFYVTFDSSVILTPETRIYLRDVENNSESKSKTDIIGCKEYNPSTKEINPIELIELVGKIKYAVYNKYCIKTPNHLIFNTNNIDVPEITYRLIITNLYFTDVDNGDLDNI